MSDILTQLRKALKSASSPEQRKKEQKFFKEKIKVYGVNVWNSRKIGKKYLETITDRSKDNIFKLADELWHSGYLEESIIACDWINSVDKEYEAEDLKTFETWIEKYVTNWASCDTLCNHPVGTLVMMYPEKTEELKKWAKSENRWLKRAAAVSLIIPARKGKFQKDVFEIADILLHNPDDMVQKGYGWMLKAASEAGEKSQKAVFEYVMKNKATMPRTSLRYAIEKMPKNLRAKAMAK